MKIKKISKKVLSVMLFFAMAVTIFTVEPQEIQAAEKSFSQTGTSSVLIKDKKMQYIKFKSGATGYVTLKIESTSGASSISANVTFCDGNKKALGQKSEYLTTDKQIAAHYSDALSKYNIDFKRSNCYTRSYGIRKNTTYYFAIKSSDSIKVTATVNKVNKSSNTSRKTARVISKNKKTEGVIIAGDKKADWYRINLTKAGKIQLDYTTKTNGSIVLPDNRFGIKVSFYKSDGNLFYVNGNNTSEDYVSSVVSKSWCRFYKVNSAGTKIDLDAGTYYIKVERLTKKSSGQYTLKWSTY